MCFDPVLCDLRLDVKGMSSWGVVAVSIYIYIYIYIYQVHPFCLFRGARFSELIYVHHQSQCALFLDGVSMAPGYIRRATSFWFRRRDR